MIAGALLLWYDMNMFEINNDLGQIHFSKNVIYRICSDAVNGTGDARIQNYKGGRYSGKKSGFWGTFGSSEEDFDDIDIVETGDSVRITIHIVVRFGVSISQTAEAIIDHVYREMASVLGTPPAHVTVIVTGIASKDVAKRHLEFSR